MREKKLYCHARECVKEKRCVAAGTEEVEDARIVWGHELRACSSYIRLCSLKVL